MSSEIVFKCNTCSLEKPISDKRLGENKCKQCHNKESRERYKRTQEILLKEIEEGILKVLKCSKCKSEKDVNEFTKTFRNCKECSSSSSKMYRIVNNEKLEERKEEIKKQEKIICPCCKVEKNREEYSENFINACKECTSRRNKKKYIENKDKIIKYERDKTKVKNIMKDIKQKECSCCKTIKDLSDFSLSDNGYNSHCKECRKNEMVEYRKRMKEEINSKKREQYKIKKRTINSIIVKLRKAVLRVSDTNYSKTDKAKKLLGIEPKIFQEWLKYNCEIDGIDYNNKTNTWHIDHIIPCKLFKINKEDDPNINSCFHWTNMMPLKATENLSKNSKIVLEQIDTVKNRLETFIKEHNINYEEHMNYWNTLYKDMINKVNSLNKLISLKGGRSELVTTC